MSNRLPLSASLAISFCFCVVSYADVRLPVLISDNMVLQQDAKVRIWGWADEGEAVSVRFQGAEISAVAKDGRWNFLFGDLQPGGPYTMTVKGANTIELSNILVGEVWVCAGQSNIQRMVYKCANAEEEIANADFPKIRLFNAPKGHADSPQADFPGGMWTECSPETVEDFSAVGYFFGRELHGARDVPVGLINISVGASAVNEWMKRETLEADPACGIFFEAYENRLEDYRIYDKPEYEAAFADYERELIEALANGWPAPPEPKDPKAFIHRPSGLYNAMVSPALPYAIKGAIWYQGEADSRRAGLYRVLFPGMIREWRREWSHGDFPFLIVQLAGFHGWKNHRSNTPENINASWPFLREAQALALSLPNTALAVAIDIGEKQDVHPKNKQEVGRRLCLAARGTAYGEDIVYSGPVFAGMAEHGDDIVLRFNSVGGGLAAQGGKLRGFEIAGANGEFAEEDARIDGKAVVISRRGINGRASVRYGWKGFPGCNLYNTEGLPAIPFRTDDFPIPEFEEPARTSGRN